MKAYMFCSAHLDPVWLWQWESGLSEALSTFRSAADLVDKYPDFIFNHNESLLYEWVEEHDPELFGRIKKQVSEGRWKIVGGWFLQPDCNIPCGEALFRQILRGRLYFYDKFGKLPVTAINVDPFGHARGLVQVLKKCGYKHYVITRPSKEIYDFDNEDFMWQGYDNSKIIVHRSDKGYNSVLGNAGQEIQHWAYLHKDEENALYMWGVGNHGGGPSRKDLNDLKELQNRGLNLVHSDMDEYFKTVNEEKLPTVNKGLNPVMEGCYTSIVRIKQMYRRLENDLLMVEKMASHAAISGLANYEKEELDNAWRDLLFSQFHDALPGSCIEPVEQDILRILSHGLEITARLKTKYFVALSAGQKKVENENTVSILLYNPHPFCYNGPVDVEFVLPRQMWHKDFSNPIVYKDGKRIHCQSAKESGNFNMDWCKRVIFESSLEPTKMSRFDIKFNVIEKRPVPSLLPNENGEIRVDTNNARVVINTLTGLVDSYVVDGKEYFKRGSMAVEVYNDSYNSWDGGNDFNPSKPLGKFIPMTCDEATAFTGVKGSCVNSVRVVEDGEVRCVIEADMKYCDSKMLVHYIIHKNSGVIETEFRIFNFEKEKRLKFTINTLLENGEYIGQTVFGREKLNSDNKETVSQYWQAVTDGESAITVINDGVYGSCYSNGKVGISLLRSPGYGAMYGEWGEPFHDSMYQPRMEQGERRYRFLVSAGKSDERLLKIDNEAIAFNQKPFSLAFCPSGKGKIPNTLISIDKDNVLLSCFKQSERNSAAYIVRLFETQGIKTTAKISLLIFGTEYNICFEPFEIKTYIIENGDLKETDMLEGVISI